MYSQNFACQPNQNEHRGRKKKSVTAAGKSFTFRRRSCLINFYCKNIVQQSDLIIIIVYSVRANFTITDRPGRGTRAKTCTTDKRVDVTQAARPRATRRRCLRINATVAPPLSPRRHVLALCGNTLLNDIVSREPIIVK